MRGRAHAPTRRWLVITLAAAAAGGPVTTARGGEPPQVGPSGLPLPRFVSLKSDRVNLRAGPGTEYPATWVFRRAGLPVEVIKEFDAWRQVRDSEGTNGWVLQSLLSGRRTALIAPWSTKEEAKPSDVPIRTGASDTARPVALVGSGVIANIESCDGKWCLVGIEAYHGYVEQKRLWGVYPGEPVR